MFDVGFFELVLIMVIALMVIGPDKLPGLAKTAGLWVGKAQAIVRSVKADIEQELAASDVKKNTNGEEPEGREALTDLFADVKSMADEACNFRLDASGQLQTPETKDSDKVTDNNQQ